MVRNENIPFKALLLALVFCLLAVDGLSARRAGETDTVPLEFPSLAGQLLVAVPTLRDPRFAHSVVFMVEHDAGGAMGLIVNRPIGRGPLIKILRGIGIKDADDKGVEVDLHYGGPVQPAYGFLLHTPDYEDENTKILTDKVSLSGGDLVLRALNDGTGPEKSLLMMGYAGWGPGQLENEMKRDDWIVIEDPADLLFDTPMEEKWEKAMSRETLDL